MWNRQRRATRAGAILTVLAAGSIGAVAPATPAFGVSCATNAHVYVITPNVFIKFEHDPIDGPTFDFDVPAERLIVFQLGGNGLKPNEDPFWDVFDESGRWVRTLMGSRAGGNCVSDQLRHEDTAHAGAVH